MFYVHGTLCWTGTWNTDLFILRYTYFLGFKWINDRQFYLVVLAYSTVWYSAFVIVLFCEAGEQNNQKHVVSYSSTSPHTHTDRDVFIKIYKVFFSPHKNKWTEKPNYSSTEGQTFVVWMCWCVFDSWSLTTWRKSPKQNLNRLQ